jgi:hypothetical protein
MIFPQGFEPLYEFRHDMKHPPGFTGGNLIDDILLIDHEFSFSTPTPACAKQAFPPHFRGRVGRGLSLIFIDNLRILY